MLFFFFSSLFLLFIYPSSSSSSEDVYFIRSGVSGSTFFFIDMNGIARECSVDSCTSDTLKEVEGFPKMKLSYNESQYNLWTDETVTILKEGKNIFTNTYSYIISMITSPSRTSSINSKTKSNDYIYYYMKSSLSISGDKIISLVVARYNVDNKIYYYIYFTEFKIFTVSYYISSNTDLIDHIPYSCVNVKNSFICIFQFFSPTEQAERDYKFLSVYNKNEESNYEVKSYNNEFVAEFAKLYSVNMKDGTFLVVSFDSGGTSLMKYSINDNYDTIAEDNNFNTINITDYISIKTFSLTNTSEYDFVIAYPKNTYGMVFEKYSYFTGKKLGSYTIKKTCDSFHHISMLMISSTKLGLISTCSYSGSNIYEPYFVDFLQCPDITLAINESRAINLKESYRIYFNDDELIIMFLKLSQKVNIDFLDNDAIILEENTDYQNMNFKFSVSLPDEDYDKFLYVIKKDDTVSRVCEISFKKPVCYEGCNGCTNDHDLANDLHYCINCADEYYPLSNNQEQCYKNNTEVKGYYFSKENNKFIQCQSSCLTCTSRQKCSSCAEGFIKSEILKFEQTNCIPNCRPFYYIDDPDNVCLSAEQCVGRNMKLIWEDSNGNAQCMENCPEGYEFINEGKCVKSCKELGKFADGNTCCESCPIDKKMVDEIDYKCLENCEDPRPYVLQGVYCVERCDFYEHISNNCVNGCDISEKYVLYEEESDKRYCVDDCPLHYNKTNMHTCEKLGCSEGYCYNSENYCVEGFYHNEDGFCVFFECPFFYTKTGLCVDNCPPGYNFVDVGDKKCMDKCGEDHHTYEGRIDQYGNFNCDPDSNGIDPSYKYYDELHIYYIECPSYLPYYKSSSNGNLCLKECPEDIKFSINGLCTSNCTNKIVNGTNECVVDCPSDFRYLNDSRCYKECPSGYDYHYLNNCISECPRFHDKMECVDECKNFNVGNECVEECPKNLPFSFIMNGTCVEACGEVNNYYYYENKCYNVTCPDEAPYHYFPFYECIKNCPYYAPVYNEIDGLCGIECSFDKYIEEECKDKKPPFNTKEYCFCKHTCPSGQKLLYGSISCVTECPEGFEDIEGFCISIVKQEDIDIGDNTEKEDSKDTYNIEENDFTSLISISEEPSEIINVIKKKATELYKAGAVFKTSKWIVSFKTSTKEDISKEHATLYLPECEGRVSSEYDSAKIIISVIERVSSTDNSYKVNFTFFEYGTDKQLSIDYCDGYNMRVYAPFRNTEKLNLGLAKRLQAEGYDIYNSSDPFFNDLCETYTSENGTDVALSDRREFFLRNASFCQDYCKLSKLDFDNGVAVCQCRIFTSDTNALAQSLIAKDKKEAEELEERLKKIEHRKYVMQCAFLVFRISYFSTNAGGYILMICLLLQLTFFILFYKWRLTSIKMAVLEDAEKNVQEQLEIIQMNNENIAEQREMQIEYEKELENIKRMKENEKKKGKSAKKKKKKKSKANPPKKASIKRSKSKGTKRSKSEIKKEDYEENSEEDKYSESYNKKKNNPPKSKLDLDYKSLKNKRKLLKEAEIMSPSEMNAVHGKKMILRRYKQENDIDRDFVAIQTGKEDNYIERSEESSKEKSLSSEKTSGSRNLKMRSNRYKKYDNDSYERKNTKRSKSKKNNNKYKDHPLEQFKLMTSSNESSVNSSISNDIITYSKNTKKNVKNLKNNLVAKNAKPIEFDLNTPIKMKNKKSSVMNYDNYSYNSDKYKDGKDYDIFEITYCPYEFVKIADKRSNKEMYKDTLYLTHPWIYTFILKDKYSMKIISMSLLVFSFSFSLALHCFFYTDAFVSNIYNRGGGYDFFYDFPKVLYTNIFNAIAYYGLLYLSAVKTRFMFLIMKREPRALSRYFECLRIRMIIFYVLIAGASGMCWFYIACFCATYKNSQVNFIVDWILSFVVSLITPLLTAAFSTILRRNSYGNTARGTYIMSLALI